MPEIYEFIADTTWVAPRAGEIVIECYGGKESGNGGYARGSIVVEEGESLYIRTGGAADVRRGGTALADRIIVAGQGGGGNGGGDGGGTSGTNGSNSGILTADGFYLRAYGGKGGSQSSGGAGGSYTDDGSGYGGSTGPSGTLGAGGGNGGDGYYGGGGGGLVYRPPNYAYRGGGGGGSGYIGGVTGGYMQTGTSTGAPRVVLTVVNTAPDAPTRVAPADGATLDRQQPNVLDWQFNDPDPGDSQSAYNVAYRLAGAPAWTETGWVTSTATQRTVAGGTFTAGDYEWRVRTKDAQGVESPWSSVGFFTAADTPPGPSITDPANNGTIPSEEYPVTWSTPDQDAYQLRVLDGTTVVYDTGQVDSTTARSRVVAFPDNDVQRVIELTVLSGGLWSPASTVTVTVSYTKPAEPTVALTSDDDAGSLIVTTTVQTPAVGEPAVTGIDVWIREAGTAGDGLPVARDVPPSLDVTWWLPTSGVDYEARVRAIGDNGTSTWSQWYGRAPLTVAVYGQSTYDNAIYA